VRLGPGKYKILMYASPPHVVDADYTTDEDEEEGGGLSAQVKQQFEEAQKQVPAEKLPEAKGKKIAAKTSMDKVIHDLGVEKGKIGAVRDGLSPNVPGTTRSWQNPYEFDGPYGKGIDDIMFDTKGDPVILEYKGGGSQLKGDQMTRNWICRKIAELARRNDPMATTLRDAMRNGKLSGRLYRTPVSHSGRAGDLLNVGEPVLEQSWSRRAYRGRCP
jgi:hypothetical protein